MSKYLEYFLDGVTDQKKREDITLVYGKLGGDDPDSFPVQFAILGMVVAERMERTAAKLAEGEMFLSEEERLQQEKEGKMPTHIPRGKEIAALIQKTYESNKRMEAFEKKFSASIEQLRGLKSIVGATIVFQIVAILICILLFLKMNHIL